MEKNITVVELIEKYNDFSNENTKNAFLDSTIKTVNNIYASVVSVIADAIIKASSFDNDGGINIDSYKRYLLTVFAYIDNCTNIKVSSENWTNEYDLLKTNNLLDKIINKIPKDVVEDINTVVNMKYDDLLINYQMKKYDKIAYIPEALIMGIGKAFDNYSEILKDVNWDELANLNK